MSEAAERTATSFFGRLEPVSSGVQILYNQNSNGNGSTIFSDNYTSGTYTSQDSQGADDFVVPKGKTWTVTEVDVTGVYFNGSGPSTQDVIFYKNQHGKPGKAVKKGTFTGLNGNDSAGSFAITLPGSGLSLKAGHYWVSVVANCSFTSGCGEWGWDVTSTIHGDQAVWRGPNCPKWETLKKCFGQAGDLLFDLQGTAKS